MTDNAKRFITPLTMQAVSGNPVHDDLFDLEAEAAMGHIELARWADVVLIAPASANFMARLANGTADDLLTTLCLATHAPIVVAPAMNQGMWLHDSTQANWQALTQKNVHILAPPAGSQACGDVGPGRMMEPLDIVDRVSALFANDALAGVRMLITAGPTHEAIDPVRFIANGSSGKMGYALAEAAIEAGAIVTLISGPVSLTPPARAEFISVTSAQEMHDAVMRKVAECDIFLAVAAVADYRCQNIATQKIHKEADILTLTLERNPDIVTSVAQLKRKPFIVGCAAETEKVVQQAAAKRIRKQMDMIIANQVGHGKGIGSETNEVVLLTALSQIALPNESKTKLARQLMEQISNHYKTEVKELA